MGGAVSSGRDNNELIDNLMGGNYIRTRVVERVFRVLDRADYMTPEARDQAYKDLAWRNGPLHMSAPCIYSEVMEGLELRPGLSFLNVGSGTGYLSTLVGLILGSSGISHGVEVSPYVVEYATRKLSQFLDHSPTLDEFDFCEPKFYCGNGLCLAPLQSPYDRVYCGAGCPEEYQNYFKQLIKVGGLLVMPLNDNLVQVRRVGETEWVSRSLLNVSFATLQVPTKDEAGELLKLEEQAPPRLQTLSRGVVRAAMRAGLMRRHPELREPPQRQPPAKKSCPRRICIPIEDDSDVEGLNALHDLDRASGAVEMNALLSLVLSMGQNRVAGALRFDPLDSPADSSDDDDAAGDAPADDDDDAGDGSGGSGGSGGGGGSGGSGGSGGGTPPKSDPTSKLLSLNWTERSPSLRGARATATATATSAATATATVTAAGEEGGAGARRGLVTFEFRDEARRAPPPATPSTSSPSDADASANTEAKDTPPKSGPSHDDADLEDDDDDEGPGVPAEVEIYLGKSRCEPGTSRAEDMEWEPADSSDDDTVEDEPKCKEEKRQKLDSGIGEETTPTSDSSPIKSDSKTDESDADCSRPSDSLTDDVDDRREGRRRLQKRGRSLGARSSTSTSSRSSPGHAGEGAGEAGRRRCKRRAADAGGGGARLGGGPDARRVRLSLLMKRGVKELPLPYALKKYVNLGRCFEF